MTEQIEMPEESLVPRGAGPQLRLARENKGLSVKDLTERTKIPGRLIELIEAGDFAALPARAYAVGFSRTLAREVGLDENAVVAMVRGEINLHAADQHDRRESYEPGDPARSPSRRLVWFSVIAGVILLAGLFVAARQLFWPAAEMPSLMVEEEAAQAAAPPPPAAGQASGAVVFTARGPVWARITDAEGNRILEGEYVAGQSFAVPADAVGPRMITGRPDLLSITVGGQPVAPLSTEPLTISDVPVDAASLRARPAPVASASPIAAPTSRPASTATPAQRPTRVASSPAPARTPAPPPAVTEAVVSPAESAVIEPAQ